MSTWTLALIALLILVVPCAAFYIWLKVFNGPNGERYQKLRMQGPFVPLNESDAQADAQRVRAPDKREGVR